MQRTIINLVFVNFKSNLPLASFILRSSSIHQKKLEDNIRISKKNCKSGSIKSLPNSENKAGIKTTKVARNK